MRVVVDVRGRLKHGRSGLIGDHGRCRARHREFRADEAGAILVLALVYIIVISAIVAALSTWALNDLNNTTQFSSARNTDYSANSATDLAINSIRTNPISWSLEDPSPPNPPNTLPTNCWGAQNTTSSLTTDGVAMSAWCSTFQNLASPDTRVVTISTCKSSESATACGKDPLLQAVVTFDDYPSGGGPLLTQQCTTTCGDGAILNGWNWAPGVGINSISFVSISPSVATVGGATYTPVAAATSNLPVTISLDASSVGCAISNGVVSFTGVGTCIIDANQPGNSFYYTAATQVQQSISVVSLSLTQVAAGSESTSAVSVPAPSPAPQLSVTGANGPVYLVVAAYENSASRSCTGISGSGLKSYSLIASNVWYSAGSNFFGMCVYSATGNTTAGPVTVSFSGSTAYATIQVVEVSGYNSTSVGLTHVTPSGGSDSAPVASLGNTPGGESDEVIIGDMTNSPGSLPSWQSVSGFSTPFSVSPGGSGTDTFSSALYFGRAVASTTGSLSGNAEWETVGVEIQP